MIDLGKKPTASTGLKSAKGWGGFRLGGEGVYSVLLRRTRPRRMFHLRLGFGVLVWFVGRGWRWKVRECWAGRRLGLCRCLWASTACTGQPLASERIWRGPEGFSVWGVPTTRSARSCGGMGAWTRSRRGVRVSSPKAYDGGVSGHDGPGEQLDTVLVGVA